MAPNARVARGLLVDPTDRNYAIEHGENAGTNREPERDISGHQFLPLAGQ
jgi:hypothetical protein